MQQGMAGPGVSPTPMGGIMPPQAGGGAHMMMGAPQMPAPAQPQAPPGLLQQLGGVHGIQQLLSALHGQPPGAVPGGQPVGAPQGQQGLIPQNLPTGAPLWNPQNPVGTQNLGALQVNTGAPFSNFMNGQASGLLNYLGLGGGGGGAG